MQGAGGDKKDLARLVEQRVARLRPKLLDLSRRNPLVSTSFSGRSNALLRIVDELPEKVIGKLRSGEMRFRPLPDLEGDPKDEEGRAFQDALSDAKRTDEPYLAALAEHEARGEVDPAEVQTLDRALRDRLRATLGMESRQNGTDISLTAHARANGISPGYDLPAPDATSADGRFDDRRLQTLMLAEDLERRLNGLLSKGRTWIQETGVNVMHVAVGFVEWSDPTAAKPSFAPLLLAQVEIIKHKTLEGAEFSVTLLDEGLALNAVFAQKMRGDFALDLPPFDPAEPVESYFARIGALQPRTMKMRVRRQVAFGVFPSARIAMFNDLGAQEGRFGDHPVVSALLGGNESGVATPFAAEYPIDDIDMEGGTPPTVLDADSSQLSAVIDVLNGKDMALEGPPGTGKSQTIVNVIAAAMARGKRVLFIAEKMAALEVVQSRLRSLDLDAFTLPLQASRSTKEQVMQSLRDRMQLPAPKKNGELQAAIDGFRKARSELAAYLSVLGRPYRVTGWTVHDVIGRGMGANEILANAPSSLKGPFIRPVEAWNAARIEAARNSAGVFEAVLKSSAGVGAVWRGVGDVSVDRFSLDGIRERTAAAGARFAEVVSTMEAWPEADVPFGRLQEHCTPLAEVLRGALEGGTALDAVARAVAQRSCVPLMQFVLDCRRVQTAESKFATALNAPLDPEWPARFERLSKICSDLGLPSLDEEAVLTRIEQTGVDHERHEAARALINLVVAGAPFLASRQLAEFEKVRQLVAATRPAVLLARDLKLADTAVRARVREAVSRGVALASARQLLMRVVTAVPEATPEELRSAAATLRSAGFFARLGKEFKLAKGVYAGVAKRRRFNRLEAADTLLAAADLKESLSTYEAEGTLAAALPARWRGLDTDFMLIDGLVDFSDALEAAFTGLTHKAFRQELHLCDAEVLQSLPEIDADVIAAGGPADLSARTEQLALSLAATRNGHDEIRELGRSLLRPADWTAERLQQAAASSRGLQALAAELDNDTRSAAVLGALYAGWRTPSAPAYNITTVATKVGESPLGVPVAAALQRMPQSQSVALIEELAARLVAAEQALADIGGVDRFAARVRSLRMHDACAMLAEAAADRESLQVHAELALHRRELDGMGLGLLLNALETGWQPQAPLPAVVEAAIHRCMALDVFDAHGSVLGKFAGSRIDQLRKEIAELDGRVVRLTRDRIRQELLRRARPPAGHSKGKVSEKTQLGLIEHETAKIKSHIPVRSLVERAGDALLELKPCWMMSPLAVAQYVPPNVVFDLCIIDEASQMPPEDALGAVLRAKQVMVVGDTNQLPPTSFFRKLIDDGDNEDQEGEAVVEESILEMANGVFRPARRLRWHYRSRHGSLIAFSNNHIYDDNLIVFPSADDRSADRGVSLVKVDGRYRSSVNPEEAKAIVAAAIRFMSRHPDRSLGLVTVNQKQRDLILEELQTAVNLDERAAAYIEKWAQKDQGLEEFFVKNLENVQGDERDAIFISTVYGPPEPGQPMPQRFGPITGVAGRRRLNVLFSRAKQQVVTFTSMSPSDITADEHGNAGAFMLKNWLEYAATGVIERGRRTQREPDSQFEVFVMRQLTSMGVEAVPQVGVAGYFVDIGIRHPEWPHGYILGVECDGASYHSAPSARDRDRLRQGVLEGLGWRIHRIWSTDWFMDPAREAARLRVVIEARMQELRGSLTRFGTSDHGSVST